MILLLLLLGLVASSASSSYHGYTSAFSFDANLSHQPDWMAGIPDHVNITSLSIPGTHETMTFHIDSKVLRCQNWNLTVQMEAGLRYFDIRARVRRNELHIYHGKKYTGYTFKQVLLEMFAFLDAHPSEAFIMRLKKEGPPVGRDSYSFAKALNHARLTDKATKAGAQRHLALYPDSRKPIPTLGELRSKIFLLQDFPSSKYLTFGLAWAGPQMVLEDEYNIHGERHLDVKWVAVQKALQTANASPLDNKRIYLTHLSAAIGLLPIQAAAGTVKKVQVGMNSRTGEWLDQRVGDATSRRTGIVIFDFPGKQGIESVLAWNKRVVAG
jgi:1-phosphatidylinositol phosphodiesterase